jgi:tetratricopeptide (TPR) repeat protein
LGTALARVNRLDEAIVRLAEAARLRPDAGEAHYRLGLVFQKKGEWMEARSRMEKAIELNPSAPAEYFLALGEIYGNLALSDKAVDAFKRSLAKQDSALAHIGLGSIYLDTRQYGQAIAEFEEAAKKNPSSAEAALNLATALHRAGKHHEALDRLRSLEANTTFKRTRLYYQILSGVAAKLEQWGQALEALKQASELEPGAVELYFQMGLLLLNAGALQEATLLLSRVAERFPESATVQVGLAQAYIAGDRSDLAESRLLETIRKSPEYDEPYYLLGNCYQESNRLDLALPYYQKAIARNPNRADFHFSLGLTYLRLGERDKALDHFRKAQELEPSAETLYRIASIHVEKNSLTEAQSALQKAIEAEPDHPQSRYLLFRIYSRRGEKSEAERELRIFESLKKKEEGRGGKPGGPDLKPVDYYLGSLK